VVIFTIAIFVLLAIAATAFDVGQSMVDRRHQQDASDSAALAGARYLPDDPNCPASPSPANCPKAVHAALEAALNNGFGDGVSNGVSINGAVVTVTVPPDPTSQFSNLPGYIQVTIGTTRPSIFAGTLLPASWRVAAMAVAKNGADTAAPYSFLALNKTACPSVLISGKGSVTAGGSIQVNSSCANALQTTGNAVIDVTSPTGEINVVGGWSYGGNYTVDPTPTTPAPWQPDPLADLPPPPLPLAPQPMTQVPSGSGTIPPGCPGGASAATADTPRVCQFQGNAYNGTTWRLYPGYYPGGLSFKTGTFYLEPGIYYLGGGGLETNGSGATIYSVNAGGTAPPMGGGIMIYNTEDAVYHDACAGVGTFPVGVDATSACIGAVILDGSASAIQIQAIQTGDYAGIVIFQDRNLSVDDPSTPIATRTADIQINGSASTLNVVGTIYAPLGLFQANGDAGTSSTVQVIADEFKVTGNRANITATYDASSFFKFRGVGLVE